MHIKGSPAILRAAELRALALSAGADDAACISIDRPELDDQRAAILGFYPRTRTLLSFVCRMNREPVRNPARSVANVEFHRTGERVDEVGHEIVAECERRGLRAISPPMGFPLEADRWPEPMWLVAHKPVAVAAGLGQMGIHRNVIHPRFGNFILLGTVLLETSLDPEEEAKPLDYNPCLDCMLCVAACPVGAVKAEGGFDFSACYHHNYREFMGGFGDWVEQVVESRNRMDYRQRVTPAETVSLWQSLGFGPNYKAAYCMAVCPAGDDVATIYRQNKAAHTKEHLRPLQERREPVYVIRGSDAEAHVRTRFPHKTVRPIRGSLLPGSVPGFLRGMRLTFQPGAAAGLAATYHFVFTDVPGATEAVRATAVIRDGGISVSDGLLGVADVTITAQAAAWIAFVRGEAGIVSALLRRTIRIKGPLRLLKAFGRCFPK